MTCSNVLCCNYPRSVCVRTAPGNVNMVAYGKKILCCPQYLFPMVDYYNVVLLHLSSNSIALNFLFILATLQRRSGWTCLKCFELAASGEQLLSTAMQHDVLCKMLRKHTATNRSSLSSAASRAASWITSRRNDA